MSQLSRRLTNGEIKFLLNIGKLPLTESNWKDMIAFAISLSPKDKSSIDKLSNTESIEHKSWPKLPVFRPHMKNELKVILIQEYLNSLEYNFTGTQYFQIEKYKPILHLMETAKKMIRESLPLKCLEAVILGIYLTQEFETLDRFPLSFMTYVAGEQHRHIVLGVHTDNKFGCIGMSRRYDLMFKPLTYDTIYDLIEDFRKCYIEHHHEFVEVTIGSVVPHRLGKYHAINWKALSVNFIKNSIYNIKEDIQLYCRHNHVIPKLDSKEAVRKKLNQIIDTGPSVYKISGVYTNRPVGRIPPF